MLLSLKRILSLIIIAILIFLLITSLVVYCSDFITPIDLKIIVKVQNLFSFLPIQVPMFISDFGYKLYMLPQLIILGVIMIKSKQLKEFALYLLITQGVYLSVFILKDLIQRPRPDIIYQKVLKTNYSFPSGHSSINMFFYLALILVLSGFIKNKTVRIFVNFLCIGWIFAVGFSRIYLGVHYPSDVIGGYTIGIIAFLLFSICVISFGKKKASNENPTHQEF